MKEPDKPKEKKQQKDLKKVDMKWIGTIFGTTIAISAVFSFLSTELLNTVNIAIAFLILLAIVVIGICFDLIGVAVTTADEKPFHSMAARNIPEAKEAIKMIRNASRVSSFCNDVVGDICGIISGSASAVIAATVVMDFTPTTASIVKLLMSAVVSGLTVGGKAVGKTFAINVSTPIVHFAAKVIYRIKYVLKWLKNPRKR
ncbi:MAG: hypothetical protein R3Y62_03995 [Eubacteriales bacterium]